MSCKQFSDIADYTSLSNTCTSKSFAAESN